MDVGRMTLEWRCGLMMIVDYRTVVVWLKMIHPETVTIDRKNMERI